jgi:hypothetical protein
MVTDEDVLASEARFEEKRRTVPFASAAHFDPIGREIIIDLNRGYSIRFSPERVQGLDGATVEELSEIEISSGGYGIHFPKLDADFSLEGFLAGRFGTDRWEHEWIETQREKQAA